MAESFWDRVRRALKREVAEANAAMDAKERELAATPDERLVIEQERAAQADAEFEALRKKIEGD
jgi:hypothetical protein